MIHPEDRKGVAGRLAEAERSDSRFAAEYRLERADGTYVHVEDAGVFLQNESGRNHRMLGTMKDISERKKVDEVLRQNLGEAVRRPIAGGYDRAGSGPLGTRSAPA